MEKGYIQADRIHFHCMHNVFVQHQHCSLNYYYILNLGFTCKYMFCIMFLVIFYILLELINMRTGMFNCIIRIVEM